MLFFWNSPGRMPVMSDFLVRYQTTQDNGRAICAQFSNNLLTAPVTPYYYKKPFEQQRKLLSAACIH